MSPGSCLLKLAAAFPQPAIDERTLLVYAERIQEAGILPEDLEAACNSLIDTSKHFPRCSEIIEASRKIKVARVVRQEEEERRKMLAEAPNHNRPKLMDLYRRVMEHSNVRPGGKARP